MRWQGHQRYLAALYMVATSSSCNGLLKIDELPALTVDGGEDTQANDDANGIDGARDAPEGADGANVDTPAVDHREGNGAPCVSGESCVSGLCFDGVCCDSGCGGQCESCGQSGSVGTCRAAVGAPSLGRSPCAGDGAPCAGACNGTLRMACAYPSLSQSCRNASCTNGVSMQSAACDGRGGCPPVSSTLCAPFVCGAVACKVSCNDNLDCAAGSYCPGDTCVAKLKVGSSATKASACASGFLSDGVCCDRACAFGTATDCYACNLVSSMGMCAPRPDGATCGTGLACSAGGACIPVAARSCAGGLKCGDASCCDAKQVPGGTFMQGRAAGSPEDTVCSTWASGKFCGANDQPEFKATISSFVLDTYEVTVGRFRKFVATYPGAQPAPGAGAHPFIPSSGWDGAWTSRLASDRASLIAGLKCELKDFPTWTDTPGTNESKPINCIDWFTAFAFCAWDGGRLPTESEWEYVTSGGEERVLPWQAASLATGPDSAHAVFGCLLNTPIVCTGAVDAANVGSVPMGAGKWGHQDLAGSVWEWTLDWYATYPRADSTNYAKITSGTTRTRRGGAFDSPAGYLRATQRFENDPSAHFYSVGFRCARDIP
jgi:sulfatase modifying factor 1